MIERIFASGQVADAQGNVYPLDGSEVSQAEGEFLAGLIERGGFSRTIEVGCAYGISSLYICGALSRRDSPSHTIIDPYQHSQWRAVGVNNLAAAGISFFRLIEEPSEIALPQLLRESRGFQFALIDGWHSFDQTLLDFYYVNRLLEIGGIVAIDDLWMPSVRRAVRYISNYPCYEVVGASNGGGGRKSCRRAIAQIITRAVTKLIPAGRAERIFDAAWLRPDSSRGIETASMVALKKIAPDERPWNWYAPF